MIQENQTQLTSEEFIAKYRELRVNEVNERNKLLAPRVTLNEAILTRDENLRASYTSFYNPNERKIVLLDGDCSWAENLEEILKIDGAIVKKFKSDENEAYRIKEDYGRDEKRDEKRQQAIDEANDLILVSEYICHVTFSPFVFKNIDSKDNTILFLSEKNLTTICSRDWESTQTRKLKVEGKNISIVTRDSSGNFYKFL